MSPYLSIRSSLALLCAAAIAFPPSAAASAITYTWNGNSSNSYSDSANWTCAPGCAPGSYPGNAAPNALVDAIINSNHSDFANLATPAVITSLHLGGSGDEHLSTLQIDSTSLSLGTAPVFRDDVLAIGNGGELDVFGSHANLTLDLTGGSGASVSSGGSMFVSSGNTLTLRNMANESTTLTNDGFINMSSADLVLFDEGRPSSQGIGSTFQLAGSGSMKIGGSIEGSQGDEALINGPNHTLTVSGQIRPGHFTNLGTLEGEGALQVSNLTNLSGGTLTGGSYIVDNGAAMALTQLGSGTLQSIQGNASVTMHGDGKITGGNGSNGVDALTGLSQLSGSLTLQDGASLAVNPGKTNPFQSFADPGSGNAVRVLSGSSLDLSRAAFANVATGSLTGAYEIGDHSTITYAGPDINAIDHGASLTLDGTSKPGETGRFVNTGSHVNPNGLEGTLNTVNGNLTLNAAIFTSAAASFRGDSPANGNTPAVTGNISVLNGSTLDLSGTNWRDLSSGVLRSGNFLVADSTIRYSDDDITKIGAGANLTLDSHANLLNTASGQGLEHSLDDVEGSLTLQNGADFVKAGGSFQVGFAPGSSGRVSVQNGSLLDLTGASWENLTESTLDRGGFEIGGNSLLRYSGDDIHAIGSLGGLTLDGTGELQNAAHPASGGLQASLEEIQGSFTLNGGAVFTSSASSFRTESGLQDFGHVSVLNGSTLDLSSAHWSNESSGALTNGHYEIGADSVLKYSGSDISTIAAGATLVLDGNGKLTNVNSTKNPDAVSRTLTTVNGNLIVDQGGHVFLTAKTGITAGSSAAITVDNGSTLELAVTTLDNAGSITVGDGSTLNAVKLTQTAGHTNIEAGGALEVGELDLQGGELSGDGTIYGNLVLVGGTLAPGDPQSIDVVGNYQQTLMAVLDLDFAGPGADEYDSIHVHSDATHAGDVALGGALNLTLEGGFGAGIDVGSLFHIFTWDGLRTGDFDIFNNRTFSNGQQSLTFQEIFGDHGLDLQVIAAPVTTPEPSTLSMLFGVMLLAGTAVLRRRFIGARVEVRSR